MRFLILLYKEFVVFLRNKGLLAFTLYAFTLDIYLAGVGISLTLRNARFYVEDLDLSKASRQLVSDFHKPYFNFKGYLLNDGDVPELLLNDEALGVIEVPFNFERDLKAGKPVNVGLIVNGAEIGSSYLFAAYANQIAYDFLIDNTQLRFPMINPDARVYFNQDTSSKVFMSISELMTVITIFLVLLPASAVATEKEMGNIEMLNISPVSNLTFMFAKSISMGIVVLILTFFSVTLVIRGILNVPFNGSLFDFMVFTAIYSFAATGLSMFIAAVSKNMLQVTQLMVLILAPVLYLSGAWTPIESMPRFLRYLSYLSPLKYYIDGAFGIAIRGLGILDLKFDVASLLIMSIVLFIAGNAFMSRNIEG